MKRRLAALGIAVGAFLLAAPRPAAAHGIGGRLDLPVPVTFFVAAAGFVLVVSFAALAVLWPRPRLQDGPQYEGPPRRLPAPWLWASLGVVGLVLVVGQVVPPLLGLDTVRGRPTVAPVLVWVVFWLVIPFASALIGNWYALVNPWRALARWTGIGEREREELEHSLGLWPAAGVLFAFTWLELVSPGSGDPRALGVAASVYTVWLLGAMWWAGRDTGALVFDAFTPYNRLISAISPVGRDEDGRVLWRGWLRSLPVLPEWPGLAAFVIVAIGTVTYDGASATDWFRDNFPTVGTSQLLGTVALAASVALIGAGYLAACRVASAMADGTWSTSRVAQRFAHTLVPIALAYALAHYVTLILFEGQQLISGISDPFALGWDLFGTSERRIDFFLTASEPIWYFQVAVIVVGHLVAVALAHDRALADFGSEAVRSQYAMLALMIVLTTVGLLVLSG